VPGKPLNPIDEYVGNRVRVRRLMLGMSEAKLGKALGLTVDQIQNLEAGADGISASNLHVLADVLQVPGAAFFFEGAPSAKSPRKANGSSANFLLSFPTGLDDYAFVRAYLRIKQPNIRRCLVVLVEAIAYGDH
jgi:transcriptional regulator with XRE-family HTH domain